MGTVLKIIALFSVQNAKGEHPIVLEGISDHFLIARLENVQRSGVVRKEISVR